MLELDDLHRADEPSVRRLAFVSPLRGLPVVVAASYRDGEAGPATALGEVLGQAAAPRPPTEPGRARTHRGGGAHRDDHRLAAVPVREVSLGRWAFAHPLVRAVLHDGLGAARRVRAHQQVGDAYGLGGPELGCHLRRSVRTGRFCACDPAEPLDWEL